MNAFTKAGILFVCAALGGCNAHRDFDPKGLKRGTIETLSSAGIWKFDLLSPGQATQHYPPPFPTGLAFPVRLPADPKGASYLYFDTNLSFPSSSGCTKYTLLDATLRVWGNCLTPRLEFHTWDTRTALNAFTSFAARPATSLFFTYTPPASAYPQPYFEVDVTQALSSSFAAGGTAPGLMITAANCVGCANLPFDIVKLELFVNYSSTNTCPVYSGAGGNTK